MSGTKNKRILVVEPYFGGSHRAFLEGLMDNVAAEYVLLTLPARSWKMRMQLAAPWFAAEVARMPLTCRDFDVVLCSTFVDVALLKSMLQQLPGWQNDTRYCTYFHENQFAYPDRFQDANIRQFQYINFTTALASDRLAFNSGYNRDTFLAGCGAYLKKAADMAVEDTLANVRKKSVILPPAIDFGQLDREVDIKRNGIPVIVWNHRWEHDKGPNEFFDVLHELCGAGVEFEVILLGQSFVTSPSCFARARETLGERIIHFGYTESRADYCRLLKKGDMVVSTALHEFFGIAVLEAVRAGCRPLLPKRLSYPELFPEEMLYGESELFDRLRDCLANPYRLERKDALRYTEPFGWKGLTSAYRQWLLG